MDNPLEAKIKDMIKAGGPMTFEQFMEMALYDTEFGYYRSKTLEIGKAGDFYTSSHLHPVFGAMIGKQIEEMWEFMEKPEHFQIVEVGGGTGHICGDILGFLKGRQCFESLQYIIVEINSSMKDKQESLLAGFNEKIKWTSDINEIADVRGCIFSNELLDAFPVHLVEAGDQLKEIFINVGEGGLIEQTGPVSSQAIAGYIDEFNIKLEKGYRTEVNLRIKKWLQDVGTMLQEGFVLTIDYGYNTRDYYSEDRDRGTLMCYYRHQTNEDPLLHIGMQDITSHVNFSSVKKWGQDIGLRTIGLSSQGAFLVSLGIDEEIRKLAETSADYQFELGRIKKLLMPQGMGDSHMVMVQYKGGGQPILKGFSLRNQNRYL